MGRNKDIRSESDDISGKVVITMAKKHVGIGIAAIAAGAGAATYMKKKSQKKQKKAQMDARYQDYRNTERGKQVKNKKGSIIQMEIMKHLPDRKNRRGGREECLYRRKRARLSCSCLLPGKRRTDAGRSYPYPGSNGYCRRRM